MDESTLTFEQVIEHFCDGDMRARVTEAGIAFWPQLTFIAGLYERAESEYRAANQAQPA